MNQITVQKGTKIIQILPLSEKKIKIGSEPDADIQLSSKEASPSHAEFYFENGNYIIKDLNSESRTFVNCKKIHQPTPLKKSDIINIGQYTIFLDEKIESNLSSYEKTEPEDSPGNTPSLLNKINDVAQKIKTKIEEKTIYKISCAVLLFFSLIIILLILMPGDKETALFKELEMSIQSKDYKQANLIIDSLIKLNPSNQEYLHKKKEIVTFLELQRITRLSDSDDIQDLDEALGLLNQVHSKESNIVREKSELISKINKKRPALLIISARRDLENGNFENCLNKTNEILLLDSLNAEALKLNTEALIKKAENFLVMGETQNAKAVYNSVLKNDPNNTKAKEGLKRISTLGSTPIVPPKNSPPKIMSLIAGNEHLKQNEKSWLRVNAVDPEGEKLTYDWRAQLGRISGSGEIVTYFAPEVIESDKADNITIIVKDTKGNKDTRSIAMKLIATRIAIPPEQAKEAEKLMEEAMLFLKNYNQPKKAAELFEKILKIIPDPGHELHKKAKKELEAIKSKE